MFGVILMKDRLLQVDVCAELSVVGRYFTMLYTCNIN